MLKIKPLSLLLVCSALILTHCSTPEPIIIEIEPFKAPPVMREFRAAWVATVDNIDWPSEPGLSTEAQQQEIIAILDTAQALGLNAIVFQARPQCDAFYPSDIEPWSYYLTGKQGFPPEPFYDPLAIWI